MTRAEAHRRAAASVAAARANLAELQSAHRVVELWMSGKSITQVASETGLSRSSVQRRLTASGVRCAPEEKRLRISRRHGTRIHWTPDMTDAFVRAREARRSYSECAGIVGVGLGLIKAKARELALNGRNP